MSVIFSRRRRSQSFGSYGSYKEQLATESASNNNHLPSKPELIEGYAHICFTDEKALWFRGILLTADGTSYTLTAKRTRLAVTEEELSGGRPDHDGSPDVLHDYPSPLGSRGSASDMGSVSRQSSLDARTAGELQFILEEMPAVSTAKPDDSKQPTSLPGSPPTSQQIIKALDNLLIRNTSSGGGCLHEEQQRPDGNVGNSPCLSPFRSRSGSRSQQQLETISVMYDISVSDLEDGTRHDIRRVGGRKGNNFTLRSRQLCFVTERSFWYVASKLNIPSRIHFNHFCFFPGARERT